MLGRPRRRGHLARAALGELGLDVLEELVRDLDRVGSATTTRWIQAVGADAVLSTIPTSRPSASASSVTACSDADQLDRLVDAQAVLAARDMARRGPELQDGAQVLRRVGAHCGSHGAERSLHGLNESSRPLGGLSSVIGSRLKNL